MSAAKTHTAQQIAIMTWVPEGTGHAVVIARAGTGKTSTALDAVRLMAPSTDRRVSVAMAMFNADIAAETRGKLADEGLRASATTFHAAGWSALLRAYPKVKLSGTQAKQAGVHKWDLIVEKLDIPKTYQSFAHRAMSMAKQRAFGLVCRMSDPDAWLKIVDDFDLDTLISADYLDSGLRPREDIIKDGLQWAFKALKLSNEMLDTIVDHDDQIYGPLIRDLKLWENDWLIVDECFVGDTPVLVGLDGKCMTIQEMYDTKYTGPVVSWDPVHGTVIKRVVGAKRVPVGKPLVRLRTRQRGYGVDGVRLGPLTETVRYRERTLICTTDHKVWTADGDVAAGSLLPGMTVKHETAAPVVRSYQSRYAHTITGRAALGEKADIARFGAPFKHAPGEGYGGRRGGNGRGLSKHEAALLRRLGADWQPNVIVPCGKGCRNRSLPPHYKLDVANPVLKIVIEIDGYSHGARKDQDARKTAFLESRGWKVVRITNRQVLSLTDDLLREKISGCAVDAEVISVEPWENRKHEYVYDICVEDTHCYFAHGLLVHNCQDTNPARRLLARKMVKRNGRTLWIGDPKQSIYAFTGADSDAMDIIAKEWNAKIFHLTKTFRCPKVAVRMVQQQYVPDFEAGPNNIEGDYLELSNDDFYKTEAKTLANTTVFLCRNTAPLTKAAFRLLGMGIACYVEGKDIGADIVSLVNRWSSVKTLQTLRERLQAYLEQQTAKLNAAGKERQAESLNDRVETVFAVIEGLPKGATLGDLKAKIDQLFQTTPKGETAPPRIRLMTIHRSKGLEAPTIVFLGRQELIPSRFAKREDQLEQEDNLAYVGLTRVQERLIEVRI